MERSQLINKWFNELNMSIQTEEVKERFRIMTDTLDNTELAKPLMMLERKRGSSIHILSVRYKMTKRIIQYHLAKCINK